MAKNPMQRKARNSFLLGMLITVIITGIIIGLLIFKIINTENKGKVEVVNSKEVYILNTDVKSGDNIKLADLKKIKITSEAVPDDIVKTTELEDTTIAKIDLKKGTVLSSNMITLSNSKTENDTRVQEYNMILLPSQINTDEYVDIRLRLPSGLDYIVVSKKKIEIPSILGIDSENTISIKLNESEIQVMSNAIVEAYMMEGSILYVSKYVEPGLQKSAIPTYVPSIQVQEAIRQNSNITVEARNALITRYNSLETTRKNINESLGTDNNKLIDNVKKSVEEEINKTKQERKKYLDALSN